MSTQHSTTSKLRILPNMAHLIDNARKLQGPVNSNGCKTNAQGHIPEKNKFFLTWLTARILNLIKSSKMK